MNNNPRKPEEERRRRFSGLISPAIEHVYDQILEPHIKKHKIIIVDDVWFCITLMLFSILLLITGTNVLYPIILFFTAVFIFLVYNNLYLRRLLFPKQEDRIEEFISQINKKELQEVLDFMKRYWLDSKYLIKILESRHNQNYNLYLFLINSQRITSEVLEFLIDQELYSYIGDSLFCKYISRCSDRISKPRYTKLMKNFEDNKRIIKTLNIFYYFYLKDRPYFKFFATLFHKIQNFFIYGRGKIVLFSISAILMFMVFNYFSSTIVGDITSAEHRLLLFFLLVLASAFVLAMILYLFFFLLMKLYLVFLYLNAPFKN